MWRPGRSRWYGVAPVVQQAFEPIEITQGPDRSKVAKSHFCRDCIDVHLSFIAWNMDCPRFPGVVGVMEGSVIINGGAAHNVRIRKGDEQEEEQEQALQGEWGTRPAIHCSVFHQGIRAYNVIDLSHMGVVHVDSRSFLVGELDLCLECLLD